MQHAKIPPIVHARIDDVDVDTADDLSPASRSTASPHPVTPVRHCLRSVSFDLPPPSSSPAVARIASKKNEQQKEREQEEKPRFWTRSSSSRLNEPVPDEGADLEAERAAHAAHEAHATVPVLISPSSSSSSPSKKSGIPVSPGSGVAAAMAKLGRESLSMAD